MSKKPNILFFFADDQRFDTINALGCKEISTPNLDRLVNSGTAFTHAHIPGGTCGAVCMPSRAMLHTGRTLFHLSGEGQAIPNDHTLLGELLLKNNYNTFGTGKWHNGREAYSRSFNDGGEIFFGGMNDHWNVPVYNFDPTGKYDAKCAIVNNWNLSNEVSHRACDHIHAGKHSSELFADATINYLEEYDSQNPFFAYVSLMAPHDPRTMPKKFLDMYDPEKIDLPANFMAQHPFDTGALRIRDELLEEFPRKPDAIRRHIAEYYAMISHLDHELGRIVQALKDQGKYEDTIIIFSGDNGLAVGQHGLMGKQNHYEHSIRVPLIFSGPGIPQNEKRDAFVYLLDIYPTICELLEIDIPASVDGVSMLSCIKDTDQKIRERMYFAYADTIRAVRNERYKLIEYAVNEHRTTQLFDTKTDPLELDNLVYRDDMKSVRGGLHQDMLKLRDEWDDRKHHLGKKFWDTFDSAKS